MREARNRSRIRQLSNMAIEQLLYASGTEEAIRPANRGAVPREFSDETARNRQVNLICQNLRRIPRKLVQELLQGYGPGSGSILSIHFLNGRGKVESKVFAPPLAVRVVYKPHIVIIDDVPDDDHLDVTDICLDRMVSVENSYEDDAFPPSRWFRGPDGKFVCQPAPSPLRRTRREGVVKDDTVPNETAV